MLPKTKWGSFSFPLLSLHLGEPPRSGGVAQEMSSRVGQLGWSLQPTHPHNGDQCRAIGLKHFLRMLKMPRKGWSHYCTSAGGGGHGAMLLIWEGELIFPSLLMSLKFLLRKTRLAWLCAWEMDFIPQETYLSFCSEVGTK